MILQKIELCYEPTYNKGNKIKDKPLWFINTTYKCQVVISVLNLIPNVNKNLETEYIHCIKV